MGSCAENTAKKCGITREQQDDFALSSYKKSADAWKQGSFTHEIVSVNVPQKKGIFFVCAKYIFSCKYKNNFNI